MIAQVEAGKQLVFLEDVVGDDRLVGIAFHVERCQLLVARDEKGKLRLERRARLPVVKALQERIAFGLADALRVQRLGNDLAKRALADSDGAFNCDIAGWFEQVCHGTIRFAEYRSAAPVAMTRSDSVESRVLVGNASWLHDAHRRALSPLAPRLESVTMIAEIAGGSRQLAGLATWAGFESMWPTMHAYGRSFVGLPPGTRQLALTYDDGPNDP